MTSRSELQTKLWAAEDEAKRAAAKVAMTRSAYAQDVADNLDTAEDYVPFGIEPEFAAEIAKVLSEDTTARRKALVRLADAIAELPRTPTTAHALAVLKRSVKALPSFLSTAKEGETIGMRTPEGDRPLTDEEKAHFDAHWKNLKGGGGGFVTTLDPPVGGGGGASGGVVGPVGGGGGSCAQKPRGV